MKTRIREKSGFSRNPLEISRILLAAGLVLVLIGVAPAGVAAGALAEAEDEDSSIVEESGETAAETGAEDESDEVSVSEPDDGIDENEEPDDGRERPVKIMEVSDHADSRGALAEPPAMSKTVAEERAHKKGFSSFRLNKPGSRLQFRAAFELGFLGFPKHVIQFGKAGDTFDYLEDGGQDNLFLFWRVGARFVLFEKHNIKFLYQPLDLTTNSKLQRDIRIDTVTFAEGTPMQNRYGFDFYRATYLYRFLNTAGFQLAAGAGMQIRNARITFTSVDGMQRFDSGNIGPVPLLSLEARYNVSDRFWLETEIDGFYAWIQFINGGKDPIVGAILDASIRAGFEINNFMETFVNLRYLGGGARGTNEKSSVPSDGYTNNWIHAITLSLGVGLK